MSAPTEPTKPAALILVVDDQQMIRDVARRILESQGYRVLMAADGHAAVEAVRSQPAGIALTLLDTVMPKMDGITAAAQIRALAPSMRILLMSGDNAQQMAARGNLDGIDGFLQKPFRLPTLIDAVRAALEPRPPPTSVP